MTAIVIENAKIWLTAMRLHTLPLAISAVGIGIASGLRTCGKTTSELVTALLIVATAVALQVLANFANDYGDAVHGVDAKRRIGPVRIVQAGAIPPHAMRRAIQYTALWALVLGLLTLWYALGWSRSLLWWTAVGLAAIWAAVRYTAGPNPYGYRSLGDLFVLIFFGWVAGMGSYYLLCAQLDLRFLLPSTAMGLLSVGVLNINNLRDIESDQASGKITLAVRLGVRRAYWYQVILYSIAWLLIALYAAMERDWVKWWLWIASAPAFVNELWKLHKHLYDPRAIALHLKTSVLLAVWTFVVWTVAEGIKWLEDAL